MQKALILVVVLVVIGGAFVYFSGGTIPFVTPPSNSENPVIRIENVPIRVSIADTPELRAQGLSGRTALGPTEGMLFIFDESDYHRIWMKDMLIVIDVIWIDENFKVVDIKSEMRPDTFPQAFEPRTPARFVIETNGTYAESFGIKIGDTLTLPQYLIPEDLR